MANQRGIDRWKKGRAHWNKWADGRLKAKAKLEKEGKWEVDEKGEGTTAETKRWIDSVSVNFSVYVFDAGANFSEFLFPHEANFGLAEFKNQSFHGATFSDRAVFGHATFSGTADFFRTTFRGMAVQSAPVISSALPGPT